MVEQLKWDAGRVRVWVENRKNKDKDKPLLPSISKTASESSESLNKPLLSPSPVTPTVTVLPIVETVAPPPPVNIPPPPPPVVNVPIVTTPPSPPVAIIKGDGNEAVIRALTMRIEQLEKTIGKMQQQQSVPSADHHALLLRKVSELEMKVESQVKVSRFALC